MGQKYYLAYGGGAGDVTYDSFRDRAFRIVSSLAGRQGATVRVYLQTHNPGAADWFACNPHIADCVLESWAPPSPETVARYSSPIDGFLPLQRAEVLNGVLAGGATESEPSIWLDDRERAVLEGLRGGDGPLVVAQPFAGLSDRDAFDAPTFARFVEALVQRLSTARIVVLGKNHERAHKYAHEEVLPHPNVVDLIDKEGLRFGYSLTQVADAFVGCHSNLIRPAWDAQVPNVCVLPTPSMTDHLSRLDAKYTYGFNQPWTKVYTYPFSQEQGIARDMTQLDVEGIADWIAQNNRRRE